MRNSIGTTCVCQEMFNIICKKHNIVFLENKSRGVQMATQTLIDFINENRPNCKYILHFQHDVIPLTIDFFNQISSLISKNLLDDFGAIGFNILHNGKYTKDALIKYNTKTIKSFKK